MDQIKKYRDWVKARVSERTSWDGTVICVVCLLVICTGGLAKLVAYAGLVYGAYTIYKAE